MLKPLEPLVGHVTVDPPPIIKSLKLRACFVKIKGPTPLNRACEAIATHNNSQYSTQDTAQNNRWF